MIGDQRFTVSEGGSALPLFCIQEQTGTPVGVLERHLRAYSKRLRSDLRLRSEPFVVSEGSLKVGGVAGVMGLTSGVELEVVPKCFDPQSHGWHDDFLLMAIATKLGRVLRRERVSASLDGERQDVMTLVAVAFLEEFEKLSPVPIREYRSSSWTSMSLDGELDYGEIWNPGIDGFRQSGSVLSIHNRYMGVIIAAASYLVGVVADVGIRHRLRRLVGMFPMVLNSPVGGKVPGRYTRWQYLYDLSVAVQAGHGMKLVSGGSIHAPGFVVSTELGWERLLGLAFKANINEWSVVAQAPLQLGSRGPSRRPVITHPDFVLNSSVLSEPIVVDAKYKATEFVSTRTISSQDLYEALAFLTALGSKTAFLVYPSGELSRSGVDAGKVEVFDVVNVESRRIFGVRVSTSGVGRPHGLADFGYNLGHSLLKLADLDL